jgi:XTP/dITP diphosphohydrolase
MHVILASTNAHKLAELQALFADVPGLTFELGPALEVEETGITFAENALLKANAYMHATGQPCLADDSGLVVYALDGRPGVYSARYAADDASRIARVLGELEGLPREAAFVCAMALARPDGPPIQVEGRCEGQITPAPVGSGGFGYDPIFHSPELGVTFGEASAEAKNRVSHRARATAALRAILN